MARPRTVQHRARREERTAHERADLKREQHRLVDENARLREDLEKARSDRPGKVREPSSPPEQKTTGVRCAQCGEADVRRVDLGRVVLLVCPGCKTKARE